MNALASKPFSVVEGLLGGMCLYHHITRHWAIYKLQSTSSNMTTYLQFTITGPTGSSAVTDLKVWMKLRKGSACSGAPWSGQALNQI